MPSEQRLKTIRIPVHGFVDLSRGERKIVDSRPFQRLRKIQQLSLTSMVYPGATHSRFEHSLGVLYLATQTYQAIVRNSPELQVKWSPARQKRNEQILRIYALTHDLGHGPFSHLSDQLFPEEGTFSHTHETFSARIVEETEIGQSIDEIGENLAQEYGEEAFFSHQTLVHLITNQLSEEDPSLYLLHQIMDSELDIDKMDYLLRDSLHCGVAYGNFDLRRLIDSLVAVRQKDNSGEYFFLAIEQRGIYALEAFIMARYWMFIQVYFHKTRRIFDHYLQNFLSSILPQGKLPFSIEEYLSWHDIRVWYELEKSAYKSSDQGHLWASLITERKVWKQVNKEKPCSFSSEQQMQFFQALQKKLGEHFSSHQYFLDYARKSPHKLNQTYANNKDIFLLTPNGERREITQVSQIVASLIEPIQTLRLYASPEIFAEVEKISQEIMG